MKDICLLMLSLLDPGNRFAIHRRSRSQEFRNTHRKTHMLESPSQVTPSQMLSWEYCKISRNSFLYITFLVAASEYKSVECSPLVWRTEIKGYCSQKVLLTMNYSLMYIIHEFFYLKKKCFILKMFRFSRFL